ncbi:hypothetical protein [Streptomyces sp. NPDC053048]|uniref:hypothetical protein n=1 Tax=Streptomyces sp. NPDC053048 TaxID=3365694 RepID=UPI0037D46566
MTNVQFNSPLPEESVAVSPSAPCAGCAEIKAKHYASVRDGNRKKAEATAVAMGRHLRAAHS